MRLEKMSDFFTNRADSYDEHMLQNVQGCREGYVKIAELIPEEAVDLLDLGCGTGLELDEIFKTRPLIRVTGIDLTQAMLDKLKQKHPDKGLTLIHASYFDYDFGTAKYDVALSFQTMHHFSHEDKIKLYSRVHAALKTGGRYIECDYMVDRQQEEDFFFRENTRIRKELGIAEDEFYHYDTPCTIDNQINMLCKAGFESVNMVWRIANTTMLVARK
jgi:SAM-dependent methyltransferase